MNQVNCESIRLAAMAVADGENPPIPAPEIELHLSTCDHCRSDVAQLNTLLKLLDGQRRRERTENVWDGIAESLRPKTSPQTTTDHWPWLMLLGLLVGGGRRGVGRAGDRGGAPRLAGAARTAVGGAALAAGVGDRAGG